MFRFRIIVYFNYCTPEMPVFTHPVINPLSASRAMNRLSQQQTTPTQNLRHITVYVTICCEWEWCDVFFKNAPIFVDSIYRWCFIVFLGFSSFSCVVSFVYDCEIYFFALLSSIANVIFSCLPMYSYYQILI